MEHDKKTEENKKDEAGDFLPALDEIAGPLLDWYDRGKRILPWRDVPTPYHVWLSEIMLQQTRVEAVKPYYARFLQELPDIASLADAGEERLLKLWEGLGYYNRVRNMKKAAQKIVADYGGRMPEDYEELLKLPGIGSYTAGAVSSIAFGHAVPAVDGNVLRILARLRLDGRDITDGKVKKQIESELAKVIPPGRPGDFNQALMELGAVVCIPNGMAKCGECPCMAFCRARQEDRIQEFPKKSPKKARVIEEKTVLVILDEDKVALRKRANKGLLAGMYELPSMEGSRSEEKVLEYVKKLGLAPLRIELLSPSKHIFTHREWHMTGYAVRVDELEKAAPGEGLLFVTPHEIERNYPVPSAFAAYTDFIEKKGYGIKDETVINRDSKL